MSSPSDIELAYAAGVMDSDGHFTLVRKNRKRKDDSPVVYYQPTAGCGQIHRVIPDLLADWFGGGVYPLAGSSNRIPSFQWQVYSTFAYRLAELLLPYLKLKGRQAEILLAYEATNDLPSGPRVDGRSPRLTPEKIDVRAALYAEVRSLNAPRQREFPEASLTLA